MQDRITHIFHSRAYASAEETLLEATASNGPFDALMGLIKARLIRAVERSPHLSYFVHLKSFL